MLTENNKKIPYEGMITFEPEDVGEYGELYFPLTNESGIMSSVTPKLCGDSKELFGAFEEAVIRRKEIYFMGIHRKRNEPPYELSDNFPEKFVQKFGTDKFESSLSTLKEMFFAGQRGRITPDEVLQQVEQIIIGLKETYKNVFELDETLVEKYAKPLSFLSADGYLKELIIWLQQMKQILIMEFEDNRNKEKINNAIQYIHENYHKDLNMAMVSNYVSMNYSLFSIAFKQYTQVNFVNYLKSIRIKEAKKLLETTDMKVLDISRGVGYENEKHFMKLFKEICGVSPSEYRKNNS
ncbi:AraC family transcriptional regulator [Lachnospiraceae bacterium OttesenSCG-928-D06]|nr:AraC family transcriptional regulator [Lachnospiraceae bacterium OttesenSCG-928-D06]